MMDSGKMIKKKAEESINMRMEIFMRVIGKMIKEMDMEDMNSQME